MLRAVGPSIGLSVTTQDMENSMKHFGLAVTFFFLTLLSMLFNPRYYESISIKSTAAKVIRI